MLDLFRQLAVPALIGLFFASVVLVVATDWWLNCLALAGMYLCTAILFEQIAVWQVIGVRLIVGALVVVILLFTGRAVKFGRSVGEPPSTEFPPNRRGRFEFPTGLPFRLLAAAMVSLAVWYAASQPGFTWPNLPLGLNIASYLLMALGLLNLGLTEEPLNAGMGLFMFLAGFQILYSVLESARAIVALLAGVDFALALAVSYLVLLHHAAAHMRHDA